eukprot:CAMPEP_0113666718 /NCGR_PEP_ID=MMETSP0038_2-20120614/3031_1 /TAXON_ID=2898 /ORGANISM="Cryptomonas paramecium" /LENGTH=116 /DNA_ID=CAMNT_0000582243 /DNA_START=203 /DNA_END=550 /DNA_ORIENTATION=- /assembly_acc=CAM_ASM_000170
MNQSHQMLQTRTPTRNDTCGTPVRSSGGKSATSTPNTADVRDAFSVFTQLAYYSPKIIASGLQRLRDLTDASSLKFSDDIDEAAEESNAENWTFVQQLAWMTDRQREEMQFQLSVA